MPDPTFRNPLHAWREASTLEERRALAAQTGMTEESLRQMALAYRTGGRLRITPGAARLIEIATRALHRDGLPELRREMLSPECAQCEYAKLAAQLREQQKVTQ